MQHGRVVEQGATEDVLRRPQRCVHAHADRSVSQLVAAGAQPLENSVAVLQPRRLNKTTPPVACLRRP